MKKIYQLFVSSTYEDLKKEREKVIDILLKRNCLPVGMELFPALHKEQFEYIKEKIDESDYYIVLIGGKYGSIDENGISYTEKEYDYAIETGKKVMAFIQMKPKQIETDELKRGKLTFFKEKVKQEKLVQFWKSIEDLSTKLNASLSETIECFPSGGWVRKEVGNKLSHELQLMEIDSAIQLYKDMNIESMHIIASSGISSSFLIEPLLKAQNKNSNNIPPFIHILIRKGDDQERIDQIKQHNNRWIRLSKRYVNINLRISCIDNFKLSFRGIVINGDVGLIGFNTNDYYSKKDKIIIVDQNTDAGKYLIKYFLSSFKGKQSYNNFIDAIDSTL